jgi:hypothetical protein
VSVSGHRAIVYGEAHCSRAKQRCAPRTRAGARRAHTLRRGRADAAAQQQNIAPAPRACRRRRAPAARACHATRRRPRSLPTSTRPDLFFVCFGEKKKVCNRPLLPRASGTSRNSRIASSYSSQGQTPWRLSVRRTLANPRAYDSRATTPLRPPAFCAHCEASSLCTARRLSGARRCQTLSRIARRANGADRAGRCDDSAAFSYAALAIRGALASSILRLRHTFLSPAMSSTCGANRAY